MVKNSLPDVKVGDYVKVKMVRYMRVTKDTEGALKVVNDRAVGYCFDPTSEIRFSDVKPSISDIKIGEYVKVKPDTATGSATAIYIACTASAEGALLVVADDATDFNAATQIKISTVTPTFAGTTVGSYVRATKYVRCEATDEGALEVVLNDTDPFDETTQIKLTDAQEWVSDIGVGGYVKKGA